jgi:hypothetical protein
MKASMLATVLFLTAAGAVVVGAGSVPAQESPGKDHAEKVKQAEEALRGKDRQDAMRVAALALHQWLYYPALTRVFTEAGKATPNVQALRDYQVARTLKPTGIMDAVTLVRLTDDLDLLDKLKLNNSIQLPGRASPLWMEVRGYEWLTVDGTWVITNDSSAQPLQTSTITCQRNSKSCEETTVIFADKGFVSVNKSEYSVTSWMPDGVRAVSSAASCADYVIHIRRVDDKPGKTTPGLVTGHRTVKAGGKDLLGQSCDMLTPHLSLRLDVGHQVQQRYREQLWKALGYPAPKER